MIDKIFIVLGRTGDICNAIPLALLAHKGGEKVGIMSCSEFSNVLDGINYAEKIVFDGKPWEVEKAFNQAKQLCNKVVVVQVNGPVDVIRKYAYEPAGQSQCVTDSFCRESFKLAGQEKEWGRVPLIFNNRDQEREKLLMPKGWFGAGKKKKIILLSAGSVSSPFPYRDLLVELLTLKYPNFNIIDLATIKAERFYDLLGLYEAAHCLVTVDTGHLHLAAAVPTLPVMALIQDRNKGVESYWHGSAWRPKHHFYCRYQDFPRRALEMFVAIENISNPPMSNVIHVYHGGISKNDTVNCFAIQPGSCRRDAVNSLGDKEHFPMLRDVLRMVMQVSKIDSNIVLTREDTLGQTAILEKEPFYAYRMNRDKDGNDTFFPACDLFAAPVSFWVEIANKLPDLVFDNTPTWARVLVELFKMNGAVEIGGIYRNEFQF